MKNTQGMYHYFSDQVGWLELQTSERGVQSISYIDKPSPIRQVKSNSILESLVKELDEYFAGKTKDFSVPLDPEVGTSFERRVWQELTRIPHGQTRSYKEIANAVGNPKGARAVGSANKKNPIPILAPCHRVIKSDGSLGGYNSGLERKRALLELEGIQGLT